MNKTPWTTGKTKLGDGAVYDANGQCVCVIVDPNKADIETASFIVRVVNAHDALVSQLRQHHDDTVDADHYERLAAGDTGCTTCTLIAKAERQ